MANLCRDFLEKYGTHVSTGTVHFGGSYEWKSEYTGKITSGNENYKKDVAGALSSVVDGSYGFASVSAGVEADVELQTKQNFLHVTVTQV